MCFLLPLFLLGIARASPAVGGAASATNQSRSTPVVLQDFLVVTADTETQYFKVVQPMTDTHDFHVLLGNSKCKLAGEMEVPFMSKGETILYLSERCRPHHDEHLWLRNKWNQTASWTVVGVVVRKNGNLDVLGTRIGFAAAALDEWAIGTLDFHDTPFFGAQDASVVPEPTTATTVSPEQKYQSCLQYLKAVEGMEGEEAGRKCHDLVPPPPGTPTWSPTSSPTTPAPTPRPTLPTPWPTSDDQTAQCQRYWVNERGYHYEDALAKCLKTSSNCVHYFRDLVGVEQGRAENECSRIMRPSPTTPAIPWATSYNEVKGCQRAGERGGYSYEAALAQCLKTYPNCVHYFRDLVGLDQGRAEKECELIGL